MTSTRSLIVNADDFGMSSGINRGIVHAHEHGAVTSTSLMVLGAAGEEAAEMANEHRSLAVGLHVDLAEWVYENGEWIVAYRHVDPDDSSAVASEVARQLGRFRALLGRDPTHLDSHQHLHRSEPLKSVLTDWSRQLSVPLRWFTADLHTCGSFYGQSGHGEPLPGNITVEFALSLLGSLPAGPTELICHPGYGGDSGSSYATERDVELATLCDPRLRAALDEREIALISFAELV